jgi:hypothetical protein
MPFELFPHQSRSKARLIKERPTNLPRRLIRSFLVPSSLTARWIILQCLPTALEFVAVGVLSSQLWCILDTEFVIHPEVVASWLTVDFRRLVRVRPGLE